MSRAADILVVFVAVYPLAMAGVWVCGGLLFRLLEEEREPAEPDGGWPGVTILVPAYNEESVIAANVSAARAIDYPELEVIVLDDGSSDSTVEAATAAAEGDARVEVVRDPVNRGKSERLNLGLARARHDLVVVTDADAHLHPLAVRFLVARITRSPKIAAVAGGPHVTNRSSLLSALQSLEAASIIGLTRRTQSLSGHTRIVAGVLGIFRRKAVLDVGGYDGRMATEDIDLTWRLLIAGWLTLYEPNALIGMQVPTTLSGLWKQRCRWARGQGEVLHEHLWAILSPRLWRIWSVGIETFLSLAWVLALVLGAIAVVLALVSDRPTVFGLGLAWGIGIAFVCMLQLAFAVGIEGRYDRPALLAFLLGPLYPLGYWAISAAAALRAELPALVRGPRKERVVWDLPRDPV